MKKLFKEEITNEIQNGREREEVSWSNKLQFLLWISKTSFSFLFIPFSPFATISNTLSMRLYTNCAHPAQHIHNQMLKSHQKMEFNGPRLIVTAWDIVGLWSFFNLNFRKIAKWFRSSLLCTSQTDSLFNVYMDSIRIYFSIFL